MEIRFPDVDWFCDNCDAYLNNQRGFDDRKYIWKCRNCGYKNSISAANIRHEDPVIHNIVGFLLGYVRSLLVFVITILLLSEVIFKQQPFVFLGCRLLTIATGAYPLLMAFSLFFERVIAKYGMHEPLGKWIGLSLFRYWLGDYFRPFQEVLSFPFALLNLLRLKVKGISYKKYFRKKCLYATAYLLLLLSVAVLFWVSGLYTVFL